MMAEEYNQPEGSGLFWGSTRTEYKKNLRALAIELAKVGIRLPGKSRKLTLGELI